MTLRRSSRSSWREGEEGSRRLSFSSAELRAIGYASLLGFAAAGFEGGADALALLVPADAVDFGGVPLGVPVLGGVFADEVLGAAAADEHDVFDEVLAVEVDDDGGVDEEHAHPEGHHLLGVAFLAAE